MSGTEQTGKLDPTGAEPAPNRMRYITTEEKVERLEVVFGQFLTDMAVLNQRAEQRHQAAEARHQAAEERVARFEREMAVLNHRAEERVARFERDLAVINQRAEQRHQAAEERVARFEHEMAEFRAESRTDRREMNRRWGDLANKLGTIIEDILAPNLRRLARDHFRFPSIDDFMVRRWRRRPGTSSAETEFDTLVVGPEAVILGEAKSSPSARDADEFAAKAAVFFEYFPEYRGRRLIPVLGSWAMADPVVDALTARRIYAMRMGEETMELANAAALEKA